MKPGAGLTTVVVGCVLLLLGAGVVALYAENAKTEPDKKDAKAPEEAAKDAPKKPVEPRSPGGTVPIPRAPVLKENTRLVDVEGLVLDMKDDLKVSLVHRAAFQPKDGLGYFILLENELLEKTLAQTAHGERPVRVRGTITVFRGRNYLQLDWAAVKRE